MDETLQRALIEFAEKENQESEIERVAELYLNRQIELAEDAASRILCPDCGAKAGVEILYGYPGRNIGINNIKRDQHLNNGKEFLFAQNRITLGVIFMHFTHTV